MPRMFEPPAESSQPEGSPHRDPLPYEVLAALEAQLWAEDPVLAAELSGPTESRPAGDEALDGSWLRGLRIELGAFTLLTMVCTWLTGWAPFLLCSMLGVTGVILLSTAEPERLAAIEERLVRMRRWAQKR